MAAERGQDGQPLERRQGRVDVRVRGAEHGPALGVQELVAVEPEIDRLGEKEEGQEAQEVRPGPRRDHRAARRQDQDPAEEVDQCRRARASTRMPKAQPERPLHERQLEHVEADVPPEQGVRDSERLRVPGEQQGLPVGAGREGHQEREHGGHRREEALEDRLQDHAARQAQRLLELPEHVRRPRPHGHPQVHQRNRKVASPTPIRSAPRVAAIRRKTGA